MQWLRNHLYLYYPVLVFALYFGVEKIAGLDVVKQYSQSDATYLFFQYKDELLAELEFVHKRNQGVDAAELPPAPEAESVAVQDLSGQALVVEADPGGDIDPGDSGFPADLDAKTLLVLGSSRLLYFDFARFDRNFPDWEMFNFSAPVTAPAYYLYILERSIERGVIPDYIILETDPFQFNSGSDAFRRSNLGFSFDAAFMAKYFAHFQRTDVSYWLARNLFAAYKFRRTRRISAIA